MGRYFVIKNELSFFFFLRWTILKFFAKFVKILLLLLFFFNVLVFWSLVM